MNSNEQALSRAQWQPVLFAERPSRLELLKLKANWPLTPLTIRVHRNHAFEHLAAVSEPWFAWWGKAVSFQYIRTNDSQADNAVNFCRRIFRIINMTAAHI